MSHANDDFTALRASDDKAKPSRPLALPSNPQAEQALLAAILISNKAYYEVAGFLKEEHFFDAIHGRLYAAMGRLISRGEVANPITLRTLFDQDPALASVGGARYLFRLAENAITVSNTEFYGRHIRDLYLRRQLIAAADQLTEDAYKADLDRSAAEILATHTIRLEYTADDADDEIVDVSRDVAEIEPRGWILGNTFCRRFVSGLVAAGAAGKTALRIAQALSVATGRPLTGEHIFRRGRVLIICLEDGLDELRRRVRAAMIHHGIHRADLDGGWLHIWTPLGRKLAEQKDRFSREIVPGELEPELRRLIAKHQIDLVIVDPLIKAHSAEETDNNAMDAVASILIRLAVSMNIAVDCLYHERKSHGQVDPGDPNRGRGASSFRDANRLLYTLTPMTEAEREEMGLDEDDRDELVRLDRSKTNLIRRSHEATWFRFIGIPLGNGTDGYPNGDTVPTVEPWHPPAAAAKLTKEKVAEIFEAMRIGTGQGEFWLQSVKMNGDWIGNLIVSRAGMTKSQAKRLLDDWQDNGVIVGAEYYSAKRKKWVTRFSIVESKAAEILGSLYRPPEN